MEIGQKKAWELLVRRVTLPEENSQIVELSFDEIKSLVQSYEVVKERVSPVRYLATLTFVFNPNLVREIFLKNGGEESSLGARAAVYRGAAVLSGAEAGRRTEGGEGRKAELR